MSDNQSLRKKTISGALWKFCERTSTQLVNFIVSIILARLLLPEDYGIIALVSVFISICDKLVVSGFSTSLVQKKDADNLDFSTVFFFSLGMSLFLYAVLFFGAPLLADFYSAYDRELLIAVIRVMGIQIIAAAVVSVQQAYISHTMQFKKTLYSSACATVLSAAVGIWMACAGCGVWALVAQYCVNIVTIMVVLVFVVPWRPDFAFSVERFKSLFSYGWKIFAASIIKVLYNDLRSLVIGKFYTSADLAFYNKGQSFPQLVESNVGGTIESVLFPALSKRQTSKEDMLVILRRAIKTSTYILMPLLAGLAAVAQPLISLLLTDKWLESVPYMQIICFTFMFMPIEIDNLQAIKAMGRSDIALKLEIVKKVIGVALLIASIPFGVMAIALSMLAGAIINAIIDAIPNKKLLGYGVGRQALDILPSFLLSAMMFVFVYPLAQLPLGNIATLAIQVVVGVAVYVLLSALTKNESMRYILTILKKGKSK
ncbi:MAG: lipopolysaccharide biosynthesis protein [Oscillospiraceae bacterium]|nr:lipopolysaccharide biosynthesis protein [Oscillospiraceae bacterium]MBQ9930332.1 lipopolysaccharide biosynthesis protein [Oscillospiraceae bacterium]